MKILKLILLITSMISISAYGMDEYNYRQGLENRIGRKHTALENKKENLERELVPIYARQIDLTNKIGQQDRRLQRLGQIQSPKFQSGTAISRSFNQLKKNQLEYKLEQEKKSSAPAISRIQNKRDWLTELQDSFY